MTAPRTAAVAALVADTGSGQQISWKLRTFW
jgi:hypothetical protein